MRKKDSKKQDKRKKRIKITSKEVKINLEQLQEDIKKAYDSMTKVLPEAIKDCKIKSFGNAAHIILPKKYVGKKAVVLVKKD